MLRNKLILLMCALLFGIGAFAQGKLSGRVVDEKGEGLPGVTVRVVNETNKGAVTDFNGYFKLDVANGAELMVSTIGYEKKSVSASDGMVVQLKPSSSQIREVVVTALGIQSEKKTLGFAQSTIKSDVITQGQNGNAVNALSGKIPGLQITSASGTPGAASFIQLRGINSIQLSTQPLIVVDGMPIDISQSNFGNPDDLTNVYLNNISGGSRALDINPDDIENISVLKGPAASALYGSQGSNGVIMITTKKGRAGSGSCGLRVDYNTSVTWDKVNKLPELQTDYLQGMSGKYQGPQTGRRESWGPKGDTMYWDGANDYPWDRNGNLVGKSNSNAKTAFSPYDPAGQFFRTGSTWNHNVALSTCTDKSMARISLGSLRQKGIIPNSDLTRITLNTTAQTQAGKNVILGTSINYSNTGGTYVQQGSNLAGVMLGLLRTPINFDNSNGYTDPKEEKAYLFSDGSMRSYRGYGIYDNPYYTINENKFTDLTNRIYGNVYGTWSPLTWLSFTNRLGGDMYATNNQQNFGTQTIEIPVAGRIAKYHDFSRTINNDLMATITPYLHKDIEASLLLGSNIRSEKYTSDYDEGNNMIIDRWYNINNTQSQRSLSLDDSRYRSMAEYYDLKLGYKGFLYLSTTGRLENASSYWPKYKSNFYPSISGSFIFSEAFDIQNKNFSFGKLRLSYATAGKNPTAQSTKTRFLLTSVQDGWTNGNPGLINGQPIYGSSILFNDDLTPEKTGTFEFGLDLRFLKNRIHLDYTYYNSISKDLFTRVPVPASSGYTRYYTNAAKIRNRGHEVQLNLVPVMKKDLRWDITVNYSRNRNTVLALADGVETIQLNGFTGSTVNLFKDKPYGVFYGSGYVRDDNGNILIQDDPTSPYYGMPDIDAEQMDLGNVMPKWLGGINNAISYKGIALNFLFETRQGGVIWNGTRGALTHFGRAIETADRDGTDNGFVEGVYGHLGADGKIYHYDADGNEIAGAGARNETKFDKNQTWYMTYGSGFAVNEPFIEDASWVRLRELGLTYTFPSNLIAKTKFIKGLKAGFVGRNLLLWTKYTGVDPETSLVGGEKAQGIDYFNNPGTKSYGIRLNVNF